MSSYKGHLVGGFVGAAGYTVLMLFMPIEQFAEYARLLNDWQPLTAVFIIAMLFALFPDVDTNSKAQDIFFWAVFPLDIILIWQGYLQAAAYLGLVAMLPIVTHHRGWTHARWAAFVVPLPLVVVPYLYNTKMLPISLVFYGAAVVGYMSHLLLDGMLWKRIRMGAGW